MSDRGREVHPPIVVSEHGDVSVLPSPRAVTTELEATDVQNHEYQAWDARGHRLRLEVVSVTTQKQLGPFEFEVRRDEVRVSESEPPVVDVQGLQTELRTFLDRWG